MRKSIVALIATFAILSPLAFAPAIPDDCNLRFRGEYRARVKNRRPNAPGHDLLGSAAPLRLPEWYRTCQQFDLRLQSQRVTIPRTNTPTIRDVENIRVTVRAFVLGVKKEPDNDVHVEVGDVAQWNTDHLVIEVPPGQRYCDARKAIWRLVVDDMGRRFDGDLPRKHLLARPVEVDITGFVFLDGVHARRGTVNFADARGVDAGRGMQGPGGQPAKVRGLYEIHPVFELKVAR